MALKSEFTGSELGTYSAIINIAMRRIREARKTRVRFMEFRFAWQWIGLNRECLLSGMDTEDICTKIQASHVDRRIRFVTGSSRCQPGLELRAIPSIANQQLVFSHRQRLACATDLLL